MTCEPLNVVPLSALREVWPLVRPKLEAIRERDGEPWLPEDVFHEILIGNAYLWTTPDIRGFCVLQIAQTSHSRDLHVWIACNRTAARAPAYWEQLKSIAAENGCRRLTFVSTRQAWARVLPNAKALALLVEEVGG